MFSANVSKSSVIGKRKTRAQVFPSGKLLYDIISKDGSTSKPNGGSLSAPVAKISTCSNVKCSYSPPAEEKKNQLHLVPYTCPMGVVKKFIKTQ